MRHGESYPFPICTACGSGYGSTQFGPVFAKSVRNQPAEWRTEMSAWIFQGNPMRFDVDAYLWEAAKGSGDITWTVPDSARDQIRVGDLAFMWRSDGRKRGSGGLVAVGKVRSAPALSLGDKRPLYDYDEPGASKERQEKTREMAEGIHLRVRIHLDEIRLLPEKGMLDRLELEADSRLGQLQILRFRAVTLSPLTDVQAGLLLRRWDTKRPSLKKT
jgi:hypothetical protein